MDRLVWAACVCWLSLLSWLGQLGPLVWALSFVRVSLFRLVGYRRFGRWVDLILSVCVSHLNRLGSAGSVGAVGTLRSSRLGPSVRFY
jgi:hypothetical protein